MVDVEPRTVLDSENRISRFSAFPRNPCTVVFVRPHRWTARPLLPVLVWSALSPRWSSASVPSPVPRDSCAAGRGCSMTVHDSGTRDHLSLPPRLRGGRAGEGGEGDSGLIFGRPSHGMPLLVPSLRTLIQLRVKDPSDPATSCGNVSLTSIVYRIPRRARLRFSGSKKVKMTSQQS